MGDSSKTTGSPKVDFWKSVKSEFSKIIWPEKTDLVKQSAAVLGISVVLGFIITFLDTVIQFGINALTAL